MKKQQNHFTSTASVFPNRKKRTNTFILFNQLNLNTMKKFILLVVIAALSSMHLCGQTRPPAGTPYMEFNVARNSSFQFKLMGHSKNTDVWVSTSPTNYTHQTISDDWSDYQTVSAGRFPMTVKIYGTIKAIDAGLELTNENNNLASIDVSKNPFLLALSCTNAKVKTLNISENSELTILECSNNLLKNLDVSQNNKLEGFNCANNQLLLLNVANGKNSKLSTFDASGNPSLTCIQVDDGFTPPANWKKDATAQWNNNSANPCPNNYQISFSTTKAVGETISLKIDAAIEDQADVWIDLNNNGIKDDGEAITAFSKTSSTEYTLGSNKVILYGKITHLDCSSNKLSSLNISQNTDLTSLICYSNKLSSLDVSQNNKLRGITCSANLLKTLDVSQNAELVNLNCLNNKLSNLDVSQNTKLVTLSCSLNQLASLNIANGNNANLYSFNATNNPNLTCIQVDDGFIPSDTWKKDATAEWNNDSANPCSDPNSYQISFTTTKAVGETIKLGVTAESADQSTIWIDLNNNGIKDVGEAVTSAPILALTEYVLGAQSITLYGKVTAFNCGSNKINSLDISQNSHLRTLRCNNNSLSSLDVRQNTNLTDLLCNSNQLSNLDVRQNTNLTVLICPSNQLSTLDISENIKLATLNCAENLIANLDFSQNPALTRLFCNGNQLKSLILDQKTKLISLSCQDNQLTSLNVANGNNANVTAFNATGNPNLTCIQVDDGFIPSDTWKKDAAAEWNNDSANPCVPIVVGINDLILNRVKIYPNPAKETLYILSDVEVLEVELFNIEGRLILKQNHSDAISIGHLPGGIYQVVIFTDNGVYTEKMIKQ